MEQEDGQMTKRKKLKKLEQNRKELEFYSFLTSLCLDMALKPTPRRSEYLCHAQFFTEKERECLEVYKALSESGGKRK